MKRFLSLLRRAAFFLTFAATVIALFYAEEDWRGKHDWESYARKCKEKGIDLDWRAYIPPPVPDNENFAMAPLFKGFFDYYYTPTNAVWRDTNIWGPIEWVSLRSTFGATPKFGDWQQGRPLDLREWQQWFHRVRNGWHKIEETWNKNGNKLPRYGDYRPPQLSAESPGAEVIQALSNFEPQLSALKIAANRPQSRFPIHYEDLGSAIIIHLAFLVNLSHILQLHAVAELECTNNQAAFDDVKLAFRCAEALASEPFLVSQRVRTGTMVHDLQPVWEGLRRHGWSPEQLREFENYFSKVDILSQYVRAFRSESAFTYASIQSIPQNPDVLSISDSPNEVRSKYAWTAAVLPVGWFYQNETSAARFFNEDLGEDVVAQTQRVYPGVSEKNAILFDKVRPRPFTFAFKILGKGLISPQGFAGAQTDFNLARVACALERYRMARGNYPKTLDMLMPDYMAALPHDIINGEPLRYRLNDDGRFTLYSVGWNEKDDGGTYPKTQYHPEDGDWVWQYPAPK